MLWAPLEEALSRQGVPELTQRILEKASSPETSPLMSAAYQSSDPDASLYVW